MSKTFKASIVGVALLALCSFAGPATAERGQGGDRQQKHQQRFEKMQSELGLSAEQAAQIKQIMESKKAETKQLREQMKATFTDEQRAAMKEARKNRKRGEGQRPSKEERQAQMAKLGISQGQIQQMKALREQMKEHRKQIKTQISAVLTSEQQAKMEEMRKNRKGKRGHRRGHRGGTQEG